MQRRYFLQEQLKIIKRELGLEVCFWTIQGGTGIMVGRASIVVGGVMGVE